MGFDGNQAQALRIGAWRAVWLNGAPHVLSYRAPDGVTSTMRVAGGVLLIERGAVLVRVEGAPSQGRAIAIARSLRCAIAAGGGR